MDILNEIENRRSGRDRFFIIPKKFQRNILAI